MPANQLITKPREEVDLTLTVTDGDVMPYTYHLHDVFSEVISLINQCKGKGIMFRFRAIYDFDTDTPTTGMVAIDPKMIISVCENPKAVER
ncbi:hypothetical protein [Limosilactobacillus allomucosae]|uniref:hypothetical protein n=1 Tax=Limosilactobacillus allomucosae TaxID=3142938 RepID=UPI0032653733